MQTPGAGALGGVGQGDGAEVEGVHVALGAERGDAGQARIDDGGDAGDGQGGLGHVGGHDHAGAARRRAEGALLGLRIHGAVQLE